jgi:hypothetical protein
VAAGIAGTVMVLWGLLALLQLRGVRIFHHTNGSRLAGFLRRGFLLVGEKPPVVRATAVGLLSGLLPCGWLWAFLVAGRDRALTRGGRTGRPTRQRTPPQARPRRYGSTACRSGDLRHPLPPELCHRIARQSTSFSTTGPGHFRSRSRVLCREPCNRQRL